MNKKELVARVSDVLQANNIRKHVQAKRCVLHISDDDGNKTDFVVKKQSTDLLFSAKDISDILSAVEAVIIESIKRGEPIVIHNFGILEPHKRAERRAPNPKTGEIHIIPEHYVLKFSYGKALRLAIKFYESMKDEIPECDMSIYDLDEDDLDVD